MAASLKSLHLKIDNFLYFPSISGRTSLEQKNNFSIFLRLSQCS